VLLHSCVTCQSVTRGTTV